MSPLAPHVVVRATTEVDRPAKEVWDALVQWDRQGDWMPLTTVRTIAPGDIAGEGQLIEAFTGVWRLGVRDPIVVSQWEPPHRCTVEHVGRVLRGWGSFEVEEVAPGRSRVVWFEGIRVPLRRLGPVGQGLIRVAALPTLVLALRRFRRYVERRG